MGGKLFKFNKIFSESSSSGGGGGSGWLLDGNTVGSEKFLGTLDNFALPFRVNNTEVARFNTSGNLLLGGATSSGGVLDLKQLTGQISFGTLSSQNPMIWFDQTSRSNTNYNIQGTAGFTRINASTSAGRVDISINNDPVTLFYSDKLRIGYSTFIGDSSFSLNPTAILDLAASTISAASLRIRSGSTPTSPNNGDVWFDSSNYFNFQGGGVFNNQLQIVGNYYFKTGGNSFFGGTSNGTTFVDIAGATTSQAALRLRAGNTPTSPNDGDIWYDGTDLKMRVGGTTKTFTLI